MKRTYLVRSKLDMLSPKRWRAPRTNQAVCFHFYQLYAGHCGY